MKKLALLLLSFGVCIIASAQMYRIVNGQYYRTDDVSNWRVFYHLAVLRPFFRGGMIVQEFEDNTTTSMNAGFKPRSFQVNSSSYQTRGQIILLKNFHSNLALAGGMDIGYVKAKLVGDINLPNFGDIDIYDVGIPYYPPAVQLTPQQKLAKRMLAESNTVAFWKEQANEGMPGYQYSLGEWYMTNDYAKDTNSGMLWLQKSATLGNLDASNALQQMQLTNSLTAQK